MYKYRQIKGMLVILVMSIGILSLKLVFMKNEFISYKNAVVFNVIEEKSEDNEEKYGYSDILECLRKNKDLQVRSINMIEPEKCNVEVNYKGDLKLLYNSLYSLNESRNFLAINSISINKDSKITNISIDFKKNK